MKKEDVSTPSSLSSIPTQPGHTSLPRTTCSTLDSTANLAGKSDVHQHEGEDPGVIYHCQNFGCDYPGTKRADQLRDHVTKKHPELLDGRFGVSMTKDDTDGSEQYP